jgi:hypothetical protein
MQSQKTKEYILCQCKNKNKPSLYLIKINTRKLFLCKEIFILSSKKSNHSNTNTKIKIKINYPHI